MPREGGGGSMGHHSEGKHSIVVRRNHPAQGLGATQLYKQSPPPTYHHKTIFTAVGRWGREGYINVATFCAFETSADPAIPRTAEPTGSSSVGRGGSGGEYFAPRDPALAPGIATPHILIHVCRCFHRGPFAELCHYR